MRAPWRTLMQCVSAADAAACALVLRESVGRLVLRQSVGRTTDAAMLLSFVRRLGRRVILAGALSAAVRRGFASSLMEGVRVTVFTLVGVLKCPLGVSRIGGRSPLSVRRLLPLGVRSWPLGAVVALGASSAAVVCSAVVCSLLSPDAPPGGPPGAAYASS
jgi:hypothetical protein